MKNNEYTSALKDKNMVLRAIKDSFIKLSPKIQAKNPVMLLAVSYTHLDVYKRQSYVC